MAMDVKFIGIDAGRTAIKLAYRNTANECIRRQLSGETLAVDWSVSEKVLNSIKSWCGKAGCHLQENSIVVLGAAGAAEYERNVTLSATKLILMGDVTLTARSCGIEESGIALLYGTGGSLTAFSPAGKTIYGSYGPVVGDLWGGVTLGRYAIRFLLEAWNSGTQSDYIQVLAETMGIQNRREYVQWLRKTSNPHADLSRLGEITVRHAEDGDAHAQQLCMLTLDAIGQLLKKAVHEMKLSVPVNVVMQGSIIENASWLREQLKITVPDCAWYRPEKPLDVYALELAESLE